MKIIFVILLFVLNPILIFAAGDILCENNDAETEFYATMMSRQQNLKEPLTFYYQYVDSEIKSTIKSVCPVDYNNGVAVFNARIKVVTTCTDTCDKQATSGKNDVFRNECKKICDIFDEKLIAFSSGFQLSAKKCLGQNRPTLPTKSGQPNVEGDQKKTGNLR